ncbi:MAG: hypothetical protein A3E83_03620 [Gammaproteobacteria bacterium RIFCSPHIGHO2_12_FULL_41_20]|nr:MAG: hypothetical protein A3E83_03620 [Gammaproteobacteria bacterium RIFCSPHIGHO2_12_FULL_41_20]
MFVRDHTQQPLRVRLYNAYPRTFDTPFISPSGQVNMEAFLHSIIARLGYANIPTHQRTTGLFYADAYAEHYAPVRIVYILAASLILTIGI